MPGLIYILYMSKRRVFPDHVLVCHHKNKVGLSALTVSCFLQRCQPSPPLHDLPSVEQMMQMLHQPQIV